jgi:hypothetical protein
MTDEEFIVAVAKQVAEMGYSGFTSITDDEDELDYMVNGGWTGIYDVVSSQDIDKLKSDWDHLLSDEEE